MKLGRFRGATFQSKAFVFSLLLLHCIVENLILKLFLYVWQCCMGVLISLKVCRLQGTSQPLCSTVPTCHTLSSEHFTNYLEIISYSVAKTSTADKPAPFLVFRATPSDQAGDGNYNVLWSPLSERDQM